MTFDVILLVCALGQPPSECVPQTARSVERLGSESSDLACMRRAMLSAPKGVEIGDDAYPKAMCIRRSE